MINDVSEVESLKQDIEYIQRQLDSSEEIDDVKEDLKIVKETIETTVPIIKDVSVLHREVELLREQNDNLTTVQTKVQILVEAIHSHYKSSEAMQSLQRKFNNIKTQKDNFGSLMTSKLEAIVDKNMAGLKKEVMQEATMSVH